MPEPAIWVSLQEGVKNQLSTLQLLLFPDEEEEGEGDVGEVGTVNVSASPTLLDTETGRLFETCSR